MPGFLKRFVERDDIAGQPVIIAQHDIARLCALRGESERHFPPSIRPVSGASQISLIFVLEVEPHAKQIARTDLFNFHGEVIGAVERGVDFISEVGQIGEDSEVFGYLITQGHVETLVCPAAFPFTDTETANRIEIVRAPLIRNARRNTEIFVEHGGIGDGIQQARDR